MPSTRKPPVPAGRAGLSPGTPDPGDNSSVTKGLDEVTRRRISYILLTFGILLLIISVGAIFAKADVAKNGIGIPFATGLAIIFVGFLGGRAGWEIKTIGASLLGSIAGFAIVYWVFFYRAENADCAFSLPCKAPSIALQFIYPEKGKGQSGDIMNCLDVTSGPEMWQKVEIKGTSGTIPNGNQYFLHTSDAGIIEVMPKDDPNCADVLRSIRLADPEAVYRVQRLSQKMPPTEERSFEVSYLRKNASGAGDDGSKTLTKTYHQGELIVVTVYLAPRREPQ